MNIAFVHRRQLWHFEALGRSRPARRCHDATRNSDIPRLKWRSAAIRFHSRMSLKLQTGLTPAQSRPSQRPGRVCFQVKMKGERCADLWPFCLFCPRSPTTRAHWRCGRRRQACAAQLHPRADLPPNIVTVTSLGSP